MHSWDMLSLRLEEWSRNYKHPSVLAIDTGSPTLVSNIGGN